MKFTTILLLTLTLASCGKTTHTRTKYKTITETKTETVTLAQDFEGVFYLDNGSMFELLQGDKGLVITDYLNQDIILYNKITEDYGNLPTLHTRAEILDNKVHFKLNVNYTNKNNIRKSNSSKLIQGLHRTDITLSLVDGLLQLHIKIYEGSLHNDIGKIILNTTLRE